MKTLLLNLVGIIGATSSSIVPVVMNNHDSVNQIETAVSPQLTKNFTLDLNTNYTSMSDGRNYDHSQSFSDFISELISFVTHKNIASWEVTKIEGKFNAIEESGFVKDYDVQTFNKGLHANKVTKTVLRGQTNRPSDSPNKWRWFLEGEIWPDSSSDWFFFLNGYPEQREFTEQEIRSGFKNTVTINYTQADKIDISVENYTNTNTMESEFVRSNNFKNIYAPQYASVNLKNLGYPVKPEWLSYKEAILLDTNEKIDDQLLDGKLGAGQYMLKVTVEANEIGIVNNIIGKMTFFMTLKFKYGDLNFYNNNTSHGVTIHMGSLSELHTLFTRLTISTAIKTGKNENAFFLLNDTNKELISASIFYDSETNNEFTEEDFKKLEFKKEKKVYALVFPTEDGKKLGIINSAKVSMEFTKN